MLNSWLRDPGGRPSFTDLCSKFRTLLCAEGYYIELLHLDVKKSQEIRASSFEGIDFLLAPGPLRVSNVSLASSPCFGQSSHQTTPFLSRRSASPCPISAKEKKSSTRARPDFRELGSSIQLVFHNSMSQSASNCESGQHLEVSNGDIATAAV